MKKIKITFCISIILVATVTTFLIGNKEKQMDKPEIALIIDGVEWASFPADDSLYDITASCTGANGTWDYNTHTLSLSRVSYTNGSVTCKVFFNSYDISEHNLSDYIISLTGLPQENNGGMVVHEVFTDGASTYDTGYRYEGKNPNNYVLFNDELWRIIGTFKGDTMGGESSKYYTKLIRNDALESLVFDYASDATHTAWNTNSLYTVLNDYYYNATDIPINYSDNTNICSRYYGYNPGICKYSKNGIKSSYKDYIFNAKWATGLTGQGNKASQVYKIEIDGISTAVSGYVGLMNASDYLFSNLESDLARTSAGTVATRIDKTWLFRSGGEWLLNPRSDVTRRLYIRFNGGLYYGYVYEGKDVRPVVYLKNNVYYKSGDGTYKNPYVLGI